MSPDKRKALAMSSGIMAAPHRTTTGEAALPWMKGKGEPPEENEVAPAGGG